MRVLVVHNRYRPEAPSGENSVVDQESAALRARGHDVELFQRHSGDIANWSLARRAALPARVLWSTESRRSLAAELARFQPDVVHVHNTFPLLTPAVLYACRDAGVPVVATLHNYKLVCASGELFRDGAVCHDCLGRAPLPALAHGCYRDSRVATLPMVASTALHASAWRTLVSAYIFISAAQAKLLEPLGLPLDRRFVKHNFVPDTLRLSAGEAARDRQPAVAYVGRLDGAKGLPFLMDAWDLFRQRRPGSSLMLTIAGGGPLQNDVSRWAEQRSSVSMLGHVPRPQVPQILGRSRAVVIPSQWEETFGMVAAEAMAAGTGTVAPRHGAFPELITEHRDGALYTPGDVRALASVFDDIDDHPSVWAGYGVQAKITHANRFSTESNMAQLEEIYRFAIDNSISRRNADAGIASAVRPSTS